jgi:hypothetical protein
MLYRNVFRKMVYVSEMLAKNGASINDIKSANYFRRQLKKANLSFDYEITGDFEDVVIEKESMMFNTEFLNPYEPLELLLEIVTEVLRAGERCS